jgi:hypothetical protein
MVRRTCLDCGRPCEGNRCPTHRPASTEAIVSASSHELVCTVDRALLDGAEVTTVMYFKSTHPRDSGFCCVSDHAPLAPTADDLVAICLDCLFDSHPEAGRGLDLARQHGRADFDGGEWIAGSL